MKTIRMAVAHRSTFVRDVVREVGRSRGVVVVGEASSAPALACLCVSERPAVALAEATFADGSEIESVLDQVGAAGARLLVVCGDPSPERLTRLLLLGASGYLHPDTTPDQVADAIEAVADGGTVLAPAAATTIVEQWRRLREQETAAPGSPHLTTREQQVLLAMADGLAAKSIAHRLGVAVKTVESHKLRVFEKLGVHTQAHAVSLAITHGLLAESPPAPAEGTPSNGDRLARLERR